MLKYTLEALWCSGKYKVNWDEALGAQNLERQATTYISIFNKRKAIKIFNSDISVKFPEESESKASIITTLGE